MADAAPEGAPILVLAKLIGDGIAARPSISASGDTLTVNTIKGSLASSESVTCDSIYNTHTAASDLLSDALTPIVSALLEGVNALLLVTGNEATSRQHFYDGVNESSAKNSSAVSFACFSIFDMLEQKRKTVAATAGVTDGSDRFVASVYASYIAVSDNKIIDALDQVGSAATLKPGEPLEVVEDDFEGVYVRGCTTFGPIPSADSMNDLFQMGHKVFEDKLAHQIEKVRSPVNFSRVIRLTITQTIRLPNAPVNSLRSHLLLIDVSGLETLAYSKSGPLAPSSTALALRAISKMVGDARSSRDVPFSPSVAGRFGAGDMDGTPQYPGLPTGRDPSDAAVLAAFPEVADNPAMSPFAVTLLTKLLAESLGGNCLTVVICTLLATGVPPEQTLAVLDVVSALRKGQSFPIVSSTIARGLLRQYRRTIRLLRTSLLEYMHRLRGRSPPPDHGPDRRRNDRNYDGGKAGKADLSGEYTQATRRGAAKDRTESSLDDGHATAAELAMKYEERLVDMSRQLLEAELENTVLRESTKADRRELVVRVAELQKENAAILNDYREMQAEHERLFRLNSDMSVEMTTLQNNIKSKAGDARLAKERSAYLEHQVQMLQAQVKDLAGRSVSGKEDVYMTQQSDLLQLCGRLRKRVAELTTDTAEYEKMSRTNMSLESLLRDVPVESGAALPESAFVDSDGRPVSYAELTNRLHKSSQQVTRMKSALEQAAVHIRQCHDQIKELKGERGMFDDSPDAENKKLRAKLETYKSHLLKARDALIAAKAARDAREHGAGDTKELELYKLQLLRLQEKCGQLSRENETVRNTITTMVESSAVKEGDDTLLGRYRAAEKRAAQVTAERMELSAALEAERAAHEASNAKHEKMLANLREDVERTRAMLAQVTSAKAGLASNNSV